MTIRITAGLLLIALPFAQDRRLNAFPLTVYLSPKPDAVMVVAQDHATRKELELHPSSAHGQEGFTIDTSTLIKEVGAGSPFLLLDIAARKDGETLDRITLKMPVALKLSSSFIKMDLKQPEISPKTIEAFSRTGLSIENDFSVFFQCRRMYRQIRTANPNHPLIVPAAYWYFAAAYELASAPSSVVAMDGEALQASGDLLDRARSEKTIASGFSRWAIDRGHWTEMLEKARRLDWKDARVIQQSAEKGDLSGAAALNLHFEQKFDSLGTKEKAAVTKEYGVNGRWLRKNEEYLEAATGPPARKDGVRE
ncbi:MAG TPA: hypothetical protein VIJ61_13075 [Thermoanaerobaculia bacterium]|jgi:hypothetical protein